MTNKQYRIESLNDFLTVPENRMDECLLDFKQWIALVNMASTNFPVKGGAFIWVDDGERALREVRIVVKSGEL